MIVQKFFCKTICLSSEFDIEIWKCGNHFVLSRAYQAQGEMNQAMFEYGRAFVANSELFVSETKENVSKSLNIDPLSLPTFLALGEHYQVGSDIDLKTSHWVTYSFLENIETTSIPSNSRDYVKKTAFVIDQLPKDGLFQHPSSQTSLRTKILPEARLRLSLALSPEVWRVGRGDGVQFDIYLDNGESVWRVLSEYIDPKNVPDHHHWLDREVELSKWASKTVTQKLFTGPGPNGDDRYDWAGWGEPRIIIPITYNFLEQFPNAQFTPADFGEVSTQTLTIDNDIR